MNLHKSLLPLVVFTLFAGCSSHTYHHVGSEPDITIRLDEWTDLTGSAPAARGVWTFTREPDPESPQPAARNVRMELEHPSLGTRIRHIYHGSHGNSTPLTWDGENIGMYVTDLYSIQFHADGRGELFFNETYIQELRALVPFDDTIENRMALMMTEVSSHFVRNLVDAGYNFTLNDLLSLRRAAVSSDYAVGLRDSGWELTGDEIVRLRRSGTPVTYAIEMREALGDPDVEELIRLRRGGVSPDYVRELQKAGYTFDSSDLLALRRSGVSASFAREAREAGYVLSADELIRLRRAGVSSSYLAALRENDEPIYPVDSIIEFRRRGLSAETIHRIRGI